MGGLAVGSEVVGCSIVVVVVVVVVVVAARQEAFFVAYFMRDLGDSHSTE